MAKSSKRGSKVGKGQTAGKTPKKDFLGPRLLVVMVLFCVAFGGLGYRAFVLQVERNKEFQKMIRDTQGRTTRMAARRGDIYDRHMTALAISITAHSIGANPRRFRHKWRVARKLSKVLNVPARRLWMKLSRDSYFIWLKRQVSEREVRAVRALKLGPGIRIEQESRRLYPNSRLASHILGYTDRDGRGLAGVERFFDRLLRGKTQTLRLLHDPKGRQLLRPGLLKLRSRWGANVVLTIDKAIQYITERELAKAVKVSKAKRGIAVVMNPHNGDVLALAIAPDFDPNRFREFKTRIRNNAAISNPYEPGSTLKALTIAIARELNLYRKNEKMDCENGRMRVGRYTIRDDHPHKWLTPMEVLKYSSNICTAKLAQRIKRRRLYEYFQAFGIGKRTGIGLPWETRGIFHHYKRWAKVSLANIAFGQGVSVTPLQLTAAISAIANGGTYYRPRLYLSIMDRKGRNIRKFPTKRMRRVISRSAATEISRMMEEVVHGKGGTGKRAMVPGIRAAGKTGTAQKPRANGRGYGRERIGSFVGFIPARDPRLTILVVIDEPKGVKYGGYVAGPAWSNIATGALRQIGYIPGGPIQLKTIPIPQPAKPAKQARPAKQADNKKTKAKQNPKSAAKPAAKPAKQADNKKANAKQSPKSAKKQTPSFMRLTLASAKRQALQWQIKMNAIGHGEARYQRPKPGAPLPSSRVVTVVFTNPR